MPKATFKNTSDGPRGVHTERGLKFIEPGKSETFEVSDVELKGAQSTGYFKIDEKGEAKAAPSAPAASTREPKA